MKNKLVIWLIIIIIIIIILCITYNYRESFKVCNYKHLILNNKQLNDLKDLLLNFIYFAKKNNINYFAISGTLLGTIRNGGLMPYDDDIDLGIFEKDITHIKKYRNYKYHFRKSKYGYIFSKKFSIVFIDIMVYTKIENKYKIINNIFPNEYFELDDIFPLIVKPFSNIQINIPAQYIKYLDRVYPNWEKEVVVNCGHYSKKCVYNKYNLPDKFNIDYSNSKYLCHSKL